MDLVTSDTDKWVATVCLFHFLGELFSGRRLYSEYGRLLECILEKVNWVSLAVHFLLECTKPSVPCQIRVHLLGCELGTLYHKLCSAVK